MVLSRREFLASSAAAAAVAACGNSTTSRSGKPAPSEKQSAVARPEPLQLLVLGGTGFLGPHVVAAARARGHQITLFNRGKTNPHLFPDLETLIGDRDGKLDALEGRRWHGVVDTSGYVPRIVKMSAELLAPNVDTYLFVSTISVYVESKQAGLDESAALATMPDPTSEDVPQFYGALKALCEKAATAAMSGRACNVRPGLIVGPGDESDRYTYWPVKIAGGGSVLAPGDGQDPVQFIDARDLAEFIVLALEQRLSKTYNLVGPRETLAWQSFLERTRTAIGSSAELVWVGESFLEQEKVQPWMDMPAWIPRSSEGGGLCSLSNAAAIAAGLRVRPVEETARDTLAWWNEQPEERRKLRYGLASEREAQILSAWKSRRG